MPDEDYEAWLYSLPAVSSGSSGKELSGTSGIRRKGVVPTVIQVLDKSIQYPVLPLVCTSMPHASLQGEHSISTDETHHIQRSTVG